MKKNIVRLLILLACFQIYSALADGLYQVELLVFEQADKRGVEKEWWPENPGSPNLNAQHISPTFIIPNLLKRPGNVTVLLHKAWQQPTGETTYLNNQKDLEGMISLTSNRFLHATVDLIWQKSLPILQQKAGLVSVSAQSNNPVGPLKLISFRLKQSQKIKSEEIRYFDHPAFGAILAIKPV